MERGRLAKATSSRAMQRALKQKPPRAVLWGRLAWHPAVKAWMEFGADATEPESIEVLRDGKQSATYRLVGAGPRGRSIIAQRATAARATLARTWHQHILPRLPGATRRYCGCRREGLGFAWLFFEDGPSPTSTVLHDPR